MSHRMEPENDKKKKNRVTLKLKRRKSSPREKGIVTSTSAPLIATTPSLQTTVTTTDGHRRGTTLSRAPSMPWETRATDEHDYGKKSPKPVKHTTKKQSKRPSSLQPQRTPISSLCGSDEETKTVTNDAAKISDKSTIFSTTTYADDDPDWSEMERYYEKRNGLSEKATTTTSIKEDTPTTLPRILNPSSYTKHRNGVLNERIDQECKVGDRQQCLVCLTSSTTINATTTIMTITAITDYLVLENNAKKPVYRQIEICDECQFRRNLMRPDIVLPLESLGFFKPLYL